MKRYQLVETYGQAHNAGSKATNDAVLILERLGFKPCPVLTKGGKTDFLSKVIQQITFWREWQKVYHRIEPGSILVLQHPFHRRHLGRYQTLKRLKAQKQVSIISLVHDVEMIREVTTRQVYQREFAQMLEVADVLIVHNERMKAWFLDQGVAKERLVSLEIFDYLHDAPVTHRSRFSREVTIAGNLVRTKSPYIYQLGQLPKTSFRLMGNGYTPKETPDNVHYLGSFKPEEVPAQLRSGFGLVWDGDSLVTCSGPTGHYLRYNNPHKLSLYLSAGLPVIVWEESAEAPFVKKEGVGLTVQSLEELQPCLAAITPEDYDEMVRNCNRLAIKLQSGYFLERAVQLAMRKLKETE